MTPIEFRARRVRLGVSQSDLAEMLDVKQVTVSRWESGTTQIPAGIEVALGSAEDAFEELVERLVDAAEDGQVRATEAVEQGSIVSVEGTALPVPVGMVLAAAGVAWWLLAGEAEEDGRPPTARIV